MLLLLMFCAIHFFFVFLVFGVLVQRTCVLLEMNSHVIFVYIVWDAMSKFTKNYMDAGRQLTIDCEKKTDV